MAGGAFGLGFEGTVDGRTSGVSSAKVVAGEDGIDDAKAWQHHREIRDVGVGHHWSFRNSIPFHRRWNLCQRDRRSPEKDLWSSDWR